MGLAGLRVLTVTETKRRVCVDCNAEGVTTRRPAPYGGPRTPRCATHHKARKAKQREAAWERRLWDTYHITPEQYWAIYEAQGRACFGCRRAKGTGRKRLSVDHDHSCCPGPVSCGKCVRGLLCGPCNRDVLGHLRDEAEALRRLADYVENPPARKVLARWRREGGSINPSSI
ncbi:endonuclease VII domain-containing protein [Saccharomonospora viridis]|uniref:endonuclease VII domain-containing protein n=1 Tax=Saccharomonospora viridis TaxID=1852 RepID=UPI003C6DFCDC